MQRERRRKIEISLYKGYTLWIQAMLDDLLLRLVITAQHIHYSTSGMHLSILNMHK